MINHPIELQFDDTYVKSPKVGGVTRKPEKVWSSNTGRTASAKMRGTIKAIKGTWSIEWPEMTQREQELIESFISNPAKPFVVMRIRRPNGEVQEAEVYFATPSFGEWVWLNGRWMCTGAKVDAIER